MSRHILQADTRYSARTTSQTAPPLMARVPSLETPQTKTAKLEKGALKEHRKDWAKQRRDWNVLAPR